MNAATVVIPARNAVATLGLQLDALAAQIGGVDFDVVVVDNASTDGTGDYARAFRTERFNLRVVEEVRLGINFARNAGTEAASAGPVLLCDADDIVCKSWVQSMVAALEPGCWVGGVIDYTGLNSEQTRRVWGAPERSSISEAEPSVDRTFGCNCGFTREMWDRIGRFDDRLSGIGGDETEFFMRAYAQGYRPRLAAEAIVSYRLRPGIRNMCRQRFRQGRNHAKMSRLPGGRTGLALPSETATWRSIAKLLVLSPTYAISSPRRLLWLSAISRHLGRSAGYRSDAF